MSKKNGKKMGEFKKTKLVLKILFNNAIIFVYYKDTFKKSKSERRL